MVEAARRLRRGTLSEPGSAPSHGPPLERSASVTDSRALRDAPSSAARPPISPWRAAVVLLGLVAVAGPWGRADVALLVGIAIALLNAAEFVARAKTLSKWLIQICVVLLGLRLDLALLRDSVVDGLALAVGTIVGAVVVGLMLGRLLRTDRETSTLITSGTAICGGSAIVAVGGAIGACASSMAVATGAIFILNAVGLWVLPPIGHALGLSEIQFGQWAGVALHDIASVGGAAKSYGTEAFDTANVVKLTRVVWITPLALLAPLFVRGSGPEGRRSPFPWFILGFLLASLLRTLVPALDQAQEGIARVSGLGFQAALFMIGLGLSRKALRQVGWRALVQATLLWVLLAGASLEVVRWSGSPDPPSPTSAASEAEVPSDPKPRLGDTPAAVSQPGSAADRSLAGD